MVTLHRSASPRAIVVKPSRRRSRLRFKCIVCGAELHSSHRRGDLFCDSHTNTGYRPACDSQLDRRVMDHLAAAWPQPLRLAASLGIDPADEYARLCVKRSVARWRARGVPITTVRGIGYRLGA